jgi:DNA-binding transcriptional LysR family regulator
VELRHLRYFVAVAEELHFRRAAERLHVAQPAVSEQVRKLEVDLGVQLFERTHRSVSLTPAGTALLEEARRVLRQAGVARQAARSAEARATMRLRIGYLPDALPGSVPRALRHVAASLPAVEVDLESGPAARLVDDVRAGRLDAAVTTLPARTNGLRTLALGEQGAVVALPAIHPQAVEPEIAIGRLAPAAMCHDEGLAPTFIEVSEPRVEHALLAVAAGAGPAILPESVTERYATPGVRFVPLAEARAVVRTVVVTQPDNDSIAIAAFLRGLDRATRTREAAPPHRLAAVAG